MLFASFANGLRMDSPPLRHHTTGKSKCTYTPHALKGQKLLTQGNALG